MSSRAPITPVPLKRCDDWTVNSSSPPPPPSSSSSPSPPSPWNHNCLRSNWCHQKKYLIRLHIECCRVLIRALFASGWPDATQRMQRGGPNKKLATAGAALIGALSGFFLDIYHYYFARVETWWRTYWINRSASPVLFHGDAREIPGSPSENESLQDARLNDRSILTRPITNKNKEEELRRRQKW